MVFIPWHLQIETPSCFPFPHLKIKSLNFLVLHSRIFEACKHAYIAEEENVGCTNLDVKESLPEEKEEGAATNKYSYTCEM